MKKAKSIFSIFLVLVFMCVSALPVLAIGQPEANIIVTPAPEGSAYEAHILLESSKSDDGASVTYTVNAAYESVLRQMIPSGDIAEYISKLSGKELQRFADSLYRKIKAAGIRTEYTAASSGGQAAFEWIEPGYTLIGQTTAGESEPFSVVMLDTSFDQETVYVTPKTETPSVEKKVMEKNDSAGGAGVWQDAADYDAGDQVAFQITGTLPENLWSYETYEIKFHDTLSSSLTYNNDAEIYAVMGPGEDDMIECTELFTIQANGSDLIFGCNDVLQAETTLNAKSFLIKYTATLSATPTLGKGGNPNTVYMEYSRNPHGTEKGQTPEDKVTVFSYQVKIDKVNHQEQPLSGAGFGLYKYIAERSDYVLIGSVQYTGSEFLFQGLDAGQYKLVEEVAPDGYNKIAPIEFQIEGVYDTESADSVLKSLAAKKLTGESITGEGQMFAADLDKGQLSTKVINRAGTELPSTGGSGTLFLYMGGGGLIAAGGLFLLRKNLKKSAD